MAKFLFVIMNDPTNLAESIKAAHALCSRVKERRP